MMRRAWSTVFALASLVMVSAVWTETTPAQQVKQTTKIEGRVIRTTPEQVIVETRDRKQVTLHVHPQTKYTRNNKTVQFTDVSVGANISAAYVTEGDRYIVNTVTVFPQDSTAQPGGATVIEGEIVRLVDNDQVLLRTSDGKEVTVYVDPQTKFEINNKVVEFRELRPGMIIVVNYDVREKRQIARQIVDLNQVQGQVVRVVGKDQVIVRTADGKEVIVFVSPETRYQLNTEGGQFTDLRPGADISVYYNVRERRNLAHRIFSRRR